MILSDLQKQLTLDINNHEIDDVNAFLSKYGALQEKVYERDDLEHPWVIDRVFHAGRRVRIPADSEILFRRCVEFVSLLKALEKQELIAITKIPAEMASGLLPVCTNEGGEAGLPDFRVLAVLGEFSTSIIYKLPALENFVTKKFMSSDELSKRWVVKAAIYGAITGAMLTTLATLLFGLLPLGKIRVVTIKKGPESHDTLTVKVVSPGPAFKDSTMRKNVFINSQRGKH